MMRPLWTKTNKTSVTTKLFTSHQTHRHPLTHMHIHRGDNEGREWHKKCASIIQKHSVWVHSIGCGMMENVRAYGVVRSKVFAHYQSKVLVLMSGRRIINVGLSDSLMADGWDKSSDGVEGKIQSCRRSEWEIEIATANACDHSAIMRSDQSKCWWCFWLQILN